MGVPLKDKQMLEDEKVKDVRTYADLVYVRIAIDLLSNSEEDIKFKTF